MIFIKWILMAIFLILAGYNETKAQVEKQAKEKSNYSHVAGFWFGVGFTMLIWNLVG